MSVVVPLPASAAVHVSVWIWLCGQTLPLTVGGTAGRTGFGRLFHGCFGQIGCLARFRLTVDHVDHPVVARFFGTHPVVAVDVARDPVDLLASVRRHELLQPGVEAQDLTRVYFDVRRGALDAGRRLVD